MSGRQDQYAGTMAVREAHRIDAAALERYLAGCIPDFHGPITVEQFRGGQSNPTYLVSAARSRYVVRRKPPGKLLPSAHAVDREYRIITALGPTDVPVPRTYALCEDEDVIGTAFYVMDYVEGRIFWDMPLPALAPDERAAIYDSLNSGLARLHQVDYRAVGLEDFGRPSGYVERQIARWTKQYRASETETIAAMEELIVWLPANLPDDDVTTLVHGDYRLDNTVFAPHAPKLLGILDWEISTLGHPVADFAYHCMPWRLPPETGRGMAGLDFDSLGIPTEEAYRDAYCRRTGRTELPHWEYYMAYNMFRMSAILQGIMGRARDGTAASEHAFETGRMARPIAEIAWAQVEAMAG